jgi:hypothetical protein
MGSANRVICTWFRPQMRCIAEILTGIEWVVA